jgi:hypothetical protein
VLLAAGQRNGFFVEPPDFFAGLIEQLQPAGLAHCLFAERAGATLGALLLITYGRRATYLYGAISNEQRPLMAGYALQWQAIQLARRLGCESYDFFGYEPHGTSDHLYAGFSRFKRQFGGRPIRLIGAHDYFSLDRLAEAVLMAVAETQALPPAGGTNLAGPGAATIALGRAEASLAVVGAGVGRSSGVDQAEEGR